MMNKPPLFLAFPMTNHDERLLVAQRDADYQWHLEQVAGIFKEIEARLGEQIGEGYLVFHGVLKDWQQLKSKYGGD